MREAQKPNTADYLTFNDFFTRSLSKRARPLDSNPNTLIAPADGIISQFGKIKGNKIFQAKGHSYSLEELLAGNYSIADRFRNGMFVTTYLSPRDYHCVHMPCDGFLIETIYVPGKLFSVNYLTTKNIPNLFARNERIICLFNTNFGPMVQILVGAIIVGSIETVWSGIVSSSHKKKIKHWIWPNENENPIFLSKGQKMGHFRLGSTVINLFVQKKVKFFEELKISSVIKMGQTIAISAKVHISSHYS